MSSILLLPWFLFLALFLAGCGEEGGQVEDSDPSRMDSAHSVWEGTFADYETTFAETVEGNATILCFRENNEPFTGTMTSHGPEGEHRVFRYREGKKHGLCIIRDKLGGRTETNYRDDVEHGLHAMFGRDGTQRFRWRYENGKKVKE